MVTVTSPAAANEQEQKRKKAAADKAKAAHLSKQLQMRLQYARLKVEHGWQRQNLNEVENLYFHHSALKGRSKPTLVTTIPPSPARAPIPRSTSTLLSMPPPALTQTSSLSSLGEDASFGAEGTGSIELLDVNMFEAKTPSASAASSSAQFITHNRTNSLSSAPTLPASSFASAGRPTHSRTVSTDHAHMQQQDITMSSSPFVYASSPFPIPSSSDVERNGSNGPTTFSPSPFAPSALPPTTSASPMSSASPFSPPIPVLPASTQMSPYAHMPLPKPRPLTASHSMPLPSPTPVSAPMTLSSSLTAPNVLQLPPPPLHQPAQLPLQPPLSQPTPPPHPTSPMPHYPSHVHLQSQSHPHMHPHGHQPVHQIAYGYPQLSRPTKTFDIPTAAPQHPPGGPGQGAGGGAPLTYDSFWNSHSGAGWRRVVGKGQSPIASVNGGGNGSGAGAIVSVGVSAGVNGSVSGAMAGWKG